jgi:AraC family transcriptional regulator
VKVQTRHATLRTLYEVVERITQMQEGAISVSDLALDAGFDPDHLNRAFRSLLGEPLGAFTRRMALERAAYRLASSRRPVEVIASEAGFSGTESFSRAFSRSFGIPPGRFRNSSTPNWRINRTSSMHWTPKDDLEVVLKGSDRVEVALIRRPPILLAALPFCAPYRDIWPAWSELRRSFPEQIRTRRLFTVYHEDGIAKAGLPARAHLGFALETSEECPTGLERVVIPSGHFASVGPFEGAEMHRRGWGLLNSELVPKGLRERLDLPGYDEYYGFPVPTDRMIFRIFLGVGLDAAHYQER